MRVTGIVRLLVGVLLLTAPYVGGAAAHTETALEAVVLESNACEGSVAHPAHEQQGTKVAMVAAARGPYHGNVDSKVFHRPGCRYYNCKNCTKVFKTRDAAIRAGYRPGGHCKP